MYSPRFEYLLPQSLEEAIEHLEQLGPGARLLAGGQSLIPMLRFRRIAPSHLIDLRKLSLHGIESANGALVIGATTTHAELERSEVIRGRYPLLADVARLIADPLIRNLGTIGGSAAHADPSGDWGPALLAARATLVAHGPGGERAIPTHEFFVGSFSTALAPAEVLTRIRLSCPADGGGAYLKIARKVGDFATVGVAVQLALDPDGQVRDCGIGITGMGISYVHAVKAGEYLIGRRLDREALRRASAIASEETHPISDRRGSARYKREMVKVLSARALETAAARAGRAPV
ncbi:MAG: FAD binding domain-containing protein [Actinomycetota bacterium]